MNVATQRTVALGAFLLTGILTASWHRGASTAGASPPPNRKIASSWDPRAAAAYLDGRQNWWITWPKSQRDHDTFCVSCHTAVPYALSRAALRQALAENAPSSDERKLLANVVKRVRLWKQVAPFYEDSDRGLYKSVESRGTESVLNALILASRDAEQGRFSDDGRTAFANMWAEQQTTGNKRGAWPWLRFNNEPWEADDSDYYGAALAALAVGTAPENYRSLPEIQGPLGMLGEYLNRECAAQPAINRAVLLWASTKVPGLIEPSRQKFLLAEVLEKQQPDGGWSLSSLAGGWKRADGTPQEGKSDGYATGLITLALQKAGVSSENPSLRGGLGWLIANQDKTTGSWMAYSLNKNKEHHLSPETALFMNDAATSYAVLSLSEAARR